MSPLIVFAAVICAAVAAPQAIKPVAIQPLAYTPTSYHTGYNHLAYNHQAYAAPSYKPYAGFAPVATPAYNPYAGFAPVATPAYKPYVAAPVAVTPFKSAAAPVVPAVQPYHAYHQYANQPQYYGQNRPVAIVKFTHDDNFDGSFVYDFESENGISNQASGYVKALGPEEQAQVMQGQYSYTAPDGTPITTRWFADETGFHAEGAHLPENVAKTAPYKTA